MENASKALIIAGSILIAILIISLGIMVFNNMSNSVKNEATLDKQAREAFNSKISPYIGKNISGSQVNTLVQLVRTIDQKAIINDDNVQRVTISGKAVVKIENDGTVTYTPAATGAYYNVEGQYDSNGLLTQITVSSPEEP